eukprot:901677-Amorphochlora_amoeboformis.AAC.1
MLKYKIPGIRHSPRGSPAVSERSIKMFSSRFRNPTIEKSESSELEEIPGFERQSQGLTPQLESKNLGRSESLGLTK